MNHRARVGLFVVVLLLLQGCEMPPAPSAWTGQREWFVAPGGSAGGSGSRSKPLDLATALGGSSPVRPGEVVWLLGGTYRACLVSRVAGTASAPIVVRQTPGERAVLDAKGCTTAGAITVEGANVWFWGFEVTNSDPQRWTDETGSNPRSLRRATGVNVYADGTKLINLVVHDNGNGLGLWSQAHDTEVYGVVLYNNGWAAPDRGHGHGMYIQNETSIKRFESVMSVGNYAMGIQAYGSAGRSIGLRFDGIISANNGAPGNPGNVTDPRRAWNLLVGANTPIDDIDITNSSFYQPAGSAGGGVRLGYGDAINGRVSLTDNYLANGAQDLELVRVRTAVVTGNTFYATRNRITNSNDVLAMITPPTDAAPAYLFDDNTYIDNSDLTAFGYVGSGGKLSWTDWRTVTGLDANSTYRTGVPGANRIVVQPNRYEPGRANIAVFNWQGRKSTTIDPTTVGLLPGQRYEIRLAQGFHKGPVATGTVDGPITIPLTYRPAAPIGTTLDLTTPEFHAFVILPLG